MTRKRETAIGRVLLVYLAGPAAVAPLALHFFDRHDDGVADSRSP